MNLQQKIQLKNHFEERLKSLTDESEIKHIEKCLEPIYKDLKIAHKVNATVTVLIGSTANATPLRNASTSLSLRRTLSAVLWPMRSRTLSGGFS